MTKVVVRTNLRNLIDMSRQRLCTRAYWEFRQLMKEIFWQLENYSDEWEDLIYDLKVFKPKCELLGYCPETRGCGKKGKRTDESKRTDEAQKPLDFIWNGKTQTKVVSRDESYD
jgi:thymidylate synthase (FAD)